MTDNTTNMITTTTEEVTTKKEVTTIKEETKTTTVPKQEEKIDEKLVLLNVFKNNNGATEITYRNDIPKNILRTNFKDYKFDEHFAVSCEKFSYHPIDYETAEEDPSKTIDECGRWKVIIDEKTTNLYDVQDNYELNEGCSDPIQHIYKSDNKYVVIRSNSCLPHLGYFIIYDNNFKEIYTCNVVFFLTKIASLDLVIKTNPIIQDNYLYFMSGRDIDQTEKDVYFERINLNKNTIKKEKMYSNEKFEYMFLNE